MTVGDWREEGACFGSADPDLWFATAPDRVAAAIAICVRCSQQERCFDFAMSAGIPHGIFGGMTPQDRDDLGLVPEDASFWSQEGVAAAQAVQRRQESDWRASLDRRGQSAQRRT